MTAALSTTNTESAWSVALWIGVIAEKAIPITQAISRIPYNTRRKSFLIIIGIVAMALSGYGIVCWFVSDHVCLYETGFTYGSSRYDAQASVRDCGATTSLNTQVTISTPSLFDLPGTYESGVVFQSTQDPTTLSLRWETATHLIIEYLAGQEGQVKKALATWKDVTITHRARTT